VSGKSVREHPEAKRMQEHVASGHISGLIFSKLARLARNTRELLDFADYFRDHDADLVSLQESIDTSTPAGRLFYTMIAAMAQWEREEIAERVAASVPVRARMGKSTGGAAPFGYQWKNRQLVPNPEEAPVRRLVYELYAEHKRKKAVARLLNQRGYRTRQRKPFTDTTVERLLADPSAKGIRRANYTRSTGQGRHWELKPEKDWVLVPIEPIVPRELWERCNALLKDGRHKPNRKGRPPSHLFTGVIFCHCGQRMYVPSNTPKYTCYRCRNKIALGDLEAVFHEQLKSFFLSPEDVAQHLGQADDEIKAKEGRLAALESEAARVRQEMDKTYRLYLDDKISADGFGRSYRPAEERLKGMEEELPRLQGELDFLKIQYLAKDEVLTETRDLYGRWPSLAASEKRAIIEAIVQRIQVGKEVVEIDLSPFPGPAELATERQRIIRDCRRRRGACAPGTRPVRSRAPGRRRRLRAARAARRAGRAGTRRTRRERARRDVRARALRAAADCCRRSGRRS
jgi:site-specific DNA recombinase